jgi:catechol 2,3-dioxygenase-like lactoylglutathione lyase family enzyme
LTRSKNASFIFRANSAGLLAVKRRQSSDIDKAKRFYDAVLGGLGAGEPVRNVAGSGHVRLFYRHDGSTFCLTQPINGEPTTAANGGTIGFKCTSAEQVKAFHDVAVAHGGQSIEDPPGVRVGAAGPMHLAYVRDPDGHKLCAIFRPS